MYMAIWWLFPGLKIGSLYCRIPLPNHYWRMTLGVLVARNISISYRNMAQTAKPSSTHKKTCSTIAHVLTSTKANQQNLGMIYAVLCVLCTHMSHADHILTFSRVCYMSRPPINITKKKTVVGIKPMILKQQSLWCYKSQRKFQQTPGTCPRYPKNTHMEGLCWNLLTTQNPTTKFAPKNDSIWGSSTFFRLKKKEGFGDFCGMVMLIFWGGGVYDDLYAYTRWASSAVISWVILIPPLFSRVFLKIFTPETLNPCFFVWAVYIGVIYSINFIHRIPEPNFM